MIAICIAPRYKPYHVNRHTHFQLEYPVLVGRDGNELADPEGAAAVLLAADVHLHCGRLPDVHRAHGHMELGVRPDHSRCHYRVVPRQQLTLHLATEYFSRTKMFINGTMQDNR